MRSVSGHPGIPVGLDDGESVGCSVGRFDKLGVGVGSDDGALEGGDVVGIGKGLVDGSNDRAIVEGDSFVAKVASLLVVFWLGSCDGLCDGPVLICSRSRPDSGV